MGAEVENVICVASTYHVHVILGLFVPGGLDGVCVFATNSRGVERDHKRKLTWTLTPCPMLEAKLIASGHHRRSHLSIWEYQELPLECLSFVLSGSTIM